MKAINKDWTGNFNSVFKTLGASNHTEHERAALDYYATSPEAVDALVGAYPNLPKRIWEPCCGEGHLSKRLEQLGYDVYSSDIADRGFGSTGVDFLLETDTHGCDCILTNPPYNKSTEIVLHALDILPESGVLAMFLKTSWLEGKQRREKIFDITPPRYVFQFSGRMVCAKNGDFESMRKVGSAVAYAWYVWEKGYKGDTILKWI